MNVVDANVLIYAVNEDAPNHAAARDWLDEALSGNEPIGFAWPALLAFLRLTTRPALFARPLTVLEATSVIEGWLARPAAVVLEPSPRHLPILRGLLIDRGAGGNAVGDAHLAALAMEHGATVVSFDADFDRFAGVRRRRPGQL